MKYGSVYTTDSLADFVVSLLKSERCGCGLPSFGNCLDPACGGFSLLDAIARSGVSFTKLSGIDFDPDAIALSRARCGKIGSEVIYKDFLRPTEKTNSIAYWHKRLGSVDTIIANPPWSSERIYDRSDLLRHGFSIVDGQYDSFSLFVELSLGVLDNGGFAAFILPDSLFSATARDLRRFIATNYEIRVIARLGEKLFDGVHRATTVIVIRKTKPNGSSTTTCFRLVTQDRRAVLHGEKLLADVFEEQKRNKLQFDFLKTDDCLFDIDASDEDKGILGKIRRYGCDWTTDVVFHRGVEISKKGTVFYCPDCGKANGVTPFAGTVLKRCKHCGKSVTLDATALDSIVRDEPERGYSDVIVGESVGRYSISRLRYLKLGVDGINYKALADYEPFKLLVRKTGLGIKTAIDANGRIALQTVYFYTGRDGLAADALYFYNALLNSRVLFYFYMKVYGENEWKSHPYLTKRILQELPLIRFNERDDAHCQIAKYARELNNTYCVETDAKLENLIKQLYGLGQREGKHIKRELAKLPDLGALKEMKQ